MTDPICQAYGRHRPVPLRVVAHHVQPQVCGGKSTAENLLYVCDSDHYAIHELMSDLLHRFGPTPMPLPTVHDLTRGSVLQKHWAVEGFARCVEAGTAAHIPNEGNLHP